MSNKRILGPNMKKMVVRKAVIDIQLMDGSLAAGIAALKGILESSVAFETALLWVDAAITAVKSAPDNHYGDDEEAIAGSLLERLDKYKAEYNKKEEK